MRSVSLPVARPYFTFILCGTGAFLCSCDIAWVHESTVKVRAGAVPNCVVSAIDSVPGVSSEPISGSYINLRVSLTPYRDGRNPSAWVALPQPLSDPAVIRIHFGYYGLREPARYKVEIPPFLDALSARIVDKCGAG